VLISLLTSDDDANPVGRFLQKRGEGIILISVEADDIENDVKSLQDQGMNFLLPEIFPRPVR
jgi:4-hydroxyphenylpyruvate dioxygenase-like putative hemolysin